MPATEVVELKGRRGRGDRSARGGLALSSFALIFLGAFVFAAGGQLLTSGSTGRVAGGAVAVAGLLLFASGFLLALGIPAQLLERRRRRRLRRERPHEPWMADHAWNQEGARDDQAWIRFERFPFFLGETADLRVGLEGRHDPAEKVAVTLRFVREKWEHRGGKTRTPVCYQHWADTREVSLQDGEVRVSFELPEGDEVTRLADHAASYWELEVARATRRCRFLVPVYRR